ncbi:MAG: oligosaccharide flippase family protein [Bacteroidales bacterium]|nr:oligosaccharide flippase family protein [Bacteroidales bacterium]
MINKIKSLVSKPVSKKLISNFISLSALQLTGIILSILVLPYLIIVLGIEKFGLVIYAQAIVTYFIVFTDYGFNLSATRDISIHINDTKKVEEIFNAVFFTKILLGVFSFTVLTFILLCFPLLKGESILYYYSFVMVIGQILFPVWFFQGVEQMKFITYLNVIAKLIFTGLILLIINKPSDYIYVNLFQGLGNIGSSIISLFFLKRKFNIRLSLPTIQQIRNELREGWHILLSSFSINIYLNSNIIILGFFSNAVILGYFSVAEKSMLIIRKILSVFSQVTYPHICKLAQISHQSLINFYKRVFFPFLFMIIIFSFLLVLFSDNLVLYLAKENNPEISKLIKLIAFVPIIVCLNIPAYQTLLAYNLKRDYSSILTLGSILSIAINTFFSFRFGAIGTCISIIITELLITIGLYIILEIRNKKYSLFN